MRNFFVKTLLCLSFIMSGTNLISGTSYLPEAEYIFPHGNGYTNYLSFMIATWDYEKIQLNDENLSVTIALNDGTPEAIDENCLMIYTIAEPGPGGDQPMPLAIMREGNVLRIDLERYIGFSDRGVYTINIPEGMVIGEDGNINEAQSFVFHVYDVVQPFESQFFPKTRTDSDKSMEITVLEPENTIVKVNWFNGTAILNHIGGAQEIFVDLSDGSRIELPYGEKAEITENGTILEMDLSGVPSGIFTIVIPEAYLTINEDTFNLDTMATYEMYGVSTGINIGEMSEDEAFDVYGCDGVLKLKKASRREMKTLPSGLYIVNGKKILVR